MRLLLLVLVTAALLAGCATTPTDKPQLPSVSTTPAGSTTPASTTPATTPSTTPQAADIIIKDFAFAPAAYDEAVNGTVSWRNDGPSTHTVTADNGAFDSGNLAPGARFEFTGTKVGTIPYHCKIHSSMRGNVTFSAPKVSTPPPTTTTTPTPTASATLVTIQGFAFRPSTLAVHVGDTVTWQNGDSTAHTATSDTNVWDTGTIGSGEAKTFTFTRAGSFPYHCSFHPGMMGTITVT